MKSLASVTFLDLIDVMEQHLGNTLVLLQLVGKQIEHKIATVQNYSASCTRYTA